MGTVVMEPATPQGMAMTSVTVLRLSVIEDSNVETTAGDVDGQHDEQCHACCLRCQQQKSQSRRLENNNARLVSSGTINSCHSTKRGRYSLVMRSSYHWITLYSSISMLVCTFAAGKGSPSPSSTSSSAAGSSMTPRRLYQIPTDALVSIGSEDFLSSNSADAVGLDQESSSEFDDAWALKTLRQVLDIPAAPATTRRQKRIPPPQYMLDLYNQIADSNGITIGENPYSAKVVRSYRLAVNNNNRRKRSTTTVHNSTAGLVLEYLLSGVRPTETLIEAELHLFRSKHFVMSPTSKRMDFYQLHIHELIDASMSSSSTSTSPQAYHIATHLVSSRDAQRWEVFKVGSAASLTGRPWHRVPSMSPMLDVNNVENHADAWHDDGRLQHPPASVKFLVTASTVDNQPLSVMGSLGRHSKQPFLVLYNEDGGPMKTSTSFSETPGASEARFKRSPDDISSTSSSAAPARTSTAEATTSSSAMPETFSSIPTTNSPSPEINSVDPSTASGTPSTTMESSSATPAISSTSDSASSPAATSNPPIQAPPTAQTFPCQRLPMYVDFELIGLENIISPKGYQAYWCHGLCSYPLGQEVSPTNHATVQSFAHHMGLVTSLAPEERAQRRRSRFPPIPVAPPCCVPTSLLSVSILFYGEDGNVALRQYDDMVAAGCSCQ